MQEQFEEFCENIKLTPNQRLDAQVKYRGVCKKIHDHFYNYEYNGDTKLIFGSYSKKKNTAIRPISEDQDVDVLFKIPEKIFNKYREYKSGGQSALLQEIREIFLDSKYSLSAEPKAWGKVILIKTADGAHNIELLPAYEKIDEKFIIPNSENSGSWEIIDPRAELLKFQISNQKTNGLTGDLSRMIKKWSREVVSLSIKSFEIECYVISFLSQNYFSFNQKPYSQIVKDFFDYLYLNVNEKDKTYVATAKSRSSKALEFETNGNIVDATLEWKKVFGDISFPSAKVDKSSNFERRILTLKNAYPSEREEYLDQTYGLNFQINPEYSLDINIEINQKGYRPRWSLEDFHKSGARIIKNAEIIFSVSHNISKPYHMKWKVRNFGDEANKMGQLRGEITADGGYEIKKEKTRYHGEHYVECYVIKDRNCVAIGKAFVPIE